MHDKRYIHYFVTKDELSILKADDRFISMEKNKDCVVGKIGDMRIVCPDIIPESHIYNKHKYTPVHEYGYNVKIVRGEVGSVGNVRAIWEEV